LYFSRLLPFAIANAAFVIVSVCTLWGGITANKVTASPAAVATKLIADYCKCNVRSVYTGKLDNSFEAHLRERIQT